MSRTLWEKCGCILEPSSTIPWLAKAAGPCFAKLRQGDPGCAELYVSGRDAEGRSRIGLVLYDLEENKVTHVAEEPSLSLGERGAFDENGTSYPYLVEDEGRDRMYYTGWIKGVHVRWYNELGVAESEDGKTFRRLSRAPIHLKNDADFIGIGSSCVIKDKDRWLMWYTRFDRWGGAGEHEHYYNIKHAVSDDGLNWRAEPSVCIDFAGPHEYAIAKPCVVKLNDRFVMWYSHRGQHYLPGVATSTDGLNWRRQDEAVGIAPSASGWDSEMLCYPFVLERGDDLFMFYNGNGYGASGLGVAVAEKRSVMEALD
jgi:hypothetical protein